MCRLSLFSLSHSLSLLFFSHTQQARLVLLVADMQCMRLVLPLFPPDSIFKFLSISFSFPLHISHLSLLKFCRLLSPFSDPRWEDYLMAALKFPQTHASTSCPIAVLAFNSSLCPQAPSFRARCEGCWLCERERRKGEEREREGREGNE